MNLNSKKWTELLFEGRNKEYGAYKLRKNSSKRHFFAFLVVLILIVASIFLPDLIAYINKISGNATSVVDIMPPIPSIRMEESLDLKEYAEQHLSPDLPGSQTSSNLTGEAGEITESSFDDGELELDDILEQFKESHTVVRPSDPDDMLEKSDTSQVYLVVDVMPSFPGGKSAMLKFITANINYPQDAQRRKAQGRVVCEFIINKDGRISDVKVIESVDPVLDKEAIRVIKLMPKWSPGERLGNPVKVKFMLPLSFRI